MPIFPRISKDPTKSMNIKWGVPKGLCFTPPPTVDKPTYEIVGETERGDGRDPIILRFFLQPGTPEYEDYYSQHPEHKGIDERIRGIAARATQKLASKDIVNYRMPAASFSAAQTLNTDQATETLIPHIVYPRQLTPLKGLKLDPDEMSLKIKAFALQLGATKVGITKINPQWINKHWGIPMKYYQSVDINYKYLICLALWQDPALLGTGLGPAMCFDVGWKYSHAALMSLVLADWIRHLGWPALPMPGFRSPYLALPHFINAGIGELSRSGIVVSKEIGNNWRPAAIATDLPLAIDKPVDFGLQDFCEKCKICADTCPSGAIPKGSKVIHKGIRKWKIDEEKCFSFWQSQGSACAVCQVVCPWSHPNNLLHNSIRELSQRFRFLRSLLIQGDRIIYGHNKPPKQETLPKWMTMPPR